MRFLIFILSIALLSATLGSEIYVLLYGLPKEIPDMLVGRILGLMDSATIIVLGYWYGTTNNSPTTADNIAKK